jgi:hypothetical protein
MIGKFLISLYSVWLIVWSCNTSPAANPCLTYQFNFVKSTGRIKFSFASAERFEIANVTKKKIKVGLKVI